jgi:hypothetical protein
MRKSLSLLAFVVLGAAMMYGQATRTWVSGVGDDANPCSRTAPCKTFAGAISKTAAQGEIDALDPGGFGALTITKSITLDGGGGQVASVLVAGTNGIVVTDGGAGTINVIIRNLRLDGLGPGTNGGLDGIKLLSARDLNVENCVIFGFQIGIEVASNTNASLHVVNTIIKNSSNDGIKVATTGGVVTAGIDDTKVMLSGADGIECGQHCHMVVNRSFVEHSAAAGIQADDAASNDANINVNHTDSSFNVDGFKVGPGNNFGSIFDSSLTFNSGCGMNNATGGGANLFSVTQGGGNVTNRNWGNTTGQCGIVSTIPAF